MTIELRRGDITTVEADAIVNAANAELRGGGGVDGAIHAAAGPDVLEELIARYPAGTPTGTAAVTGAGRLPIRAIIHAVGPRWTGGESGEAELLASAYRDSLRRAEELGARTVAFPAISCGIYGYPLDQAARIALRTVRDHLDAGSGIKTIIFVLRSADVMDAFTTADRQRGTRPR
jgi:O-acetyl-ADP-ribose deacetylase